MPSEVATHPLTHHERVLIAAAVQEPWTPTLREMLAQAVRARGVSVGRYDPPDHLVDMLELLSSVSNPIERPSEPEKPEYASPRWSLPIWPGWRFVWYWRRSDVIDGKTLLCAILPRDVPMAVPKSRSGDQR